MKKFDVIIIGGGHNGLVASSYLAKKGKKVLVIEKNEHVGGLAEYANSLSCISPIIKKELKINIHNIEDTNYIISLEDNQNHTILENKKDKLSFMIFLALLSFFSSSFFLSGLIFFFSTSFFSFA